MRTHYQSTHSVRGASILDLVLAVGLILGLVLALQVLFNARSIMDRDYQRLLTMRRAEEAFAALYLKTGSYSAAALDGCSDQGQLLSICNFSLVDKDFRSAVDPGTFAYTVTASPTDTTYTVQFTLERAYGTFAAGEHTLSPQGIH